MQTKIPFAFFAATLVAHVQFGVHQDLHVIFCQAAFHLVYAGFALSLGELFWAPLGSFLQPVEVLPHGSMIHWSISHSSHFCLISN